MRCRLAGGDDPSHRSRDPHKSGSLPSIFPFGSRSTRWNRAGECRLAQKWPGLGALGETMFEKILHRPALAIVISVIIVFLGVLGIETLPIAQFPNIAPPTVMVSIS